MKQRKDLKVYGEGDLDVERSRMMEKDASLERLEAEQASATQLRMERETEVARVRSLEFDMIAAARSQRQLEMEVASLHTENAESMRRQHELENELTILRSELATSQDRVADLESQERQVSDVASANPLAELFQQLASTAQFGQLGIMARVLETCSRQEDCEALVAVVDGLQRPEVHSNDELSNNGDKLSPDAVACPLDAISRVVETPGMGAHRTCPDIPPDFPRAAGTPDKLDAISRVVETPGMGAHRTCPHIPTDFLRAAGTPDKLDAISRVVETPGMGAHRTCPHIPTDFLRAAGAPDKLDAISRVVETLGMGAHRTCPHIPTDFLRAAGAPDKLQELQELHNQLESELATERRANAELRDAMQQELRRCEDRLAACVEAEIESRLAQWRDCMDERRASIAEQITAGGKELKQGFEAHAENLKDILAQSCRAGMARLTDLEVKAEEFEAGLVSQQDMEDRVNKLDALISGSLQNAAGECNSFRARFEHLESRLNAAMGDTGWTHICDELRKLQDEAKSQSDGMRELEKRLERQADELRADLKSHEQVTIGLVLNHLPEKDEAPHRDGRNRRR